MQFHVVAERYSQGIRTHPENHNAATSNTRELLALSYLFITRATYLAW